MHWSVLVALWYVMFRLNTWQEIQEEAQNVERERECHNPLKDGGDISGLSEVGGCKYDGERNFDQNEGEFDPEGDTEDAVVAVMNSKALILSAEEDGANDVAGDEEKEEAVVEMFMVVCVEDTQQN